MESQCTVYMIGPCTPRHTRALRSLRQCTYNPLLCRGNFCTLYHCQFPRAESARGYILEEGKGLWQRWLRSVWEMVQVVNLHFCLLEWWQLSYEVVISTLARKHCQFSFFCYAFRLKCELRAWGHSSAIDTCQAWTKPLAPSLLHEKQTMN